jgi:protein-disulfide isomerase
MKPLSISLSASVFLTAAALTTIVHAAQLSPEMRGQIEGVVKDYLLKNPEIIREASQLLAEREEAERMAAAAKALARSRDALERDAGSPVGGNTEGDITVVEFFDYNCGYCKRVAPNVKALIKTDANVRVVYKEFPILGPTSMLGAKAALAANRQGKYTPFHEALFELPEISEATIEDLSGRLGLDHAQLVKDMDDPGIAAQIARDTALARSLDINGTPGFVIGNRLVPGAIDTQTMQKIVDDERAAAKSQK